MGSTAQRLSLFPRQNLYIHCHAGLQSTLLIKPDLDLHHRHIQILGLIIRLHLSDTCIGRYLLDLC